MTRNLKDVLYSIVPQATFDCERFGVLQADAYRIAYHSSTGVNNYIVSSAKPDVPEALLAELADVLRALLREYIVDDRFGNKLAYVLGGVPQIEMAAFALSAVRAAAALGPVQAADWINNWASGKPVPYRLCAVLSGLNVDQTLEMEEGIRFWKLPTSSPEIDAHLPPGIDLHIGLWSVMGSMRMDIDCLIESAIGKPDELEIAPSQTWAHGSVSQDPVGTFCEALSLSCNGYVSSTMQWADCDEALRVLDLKIGSGYSYSREDSSPSSDVYLSPENLPNLRSTVLKRIAGRGQKQGLDRSISRWMRSKRQIGYTDQFIELRIALEALYLQGKRDELGFRLANYGAWHLGADFAERDEYRKVLSQAYRKASRAVHADEVADTEENRKLLSEAQDLCRRGILKRLDEGEAPKWDELILGAGHE